MKIRPPKLKKGRKIGIIAPAGPVSEPELQSSIKLISSLGYIVIPGPHLYNRQGYLAGDDLSRLEDLHCMFQDQDIRAVFCARGGYGVLRLLDKIDYELIRNNPKIIVGYSDITALHLAIFKKTGLITFHGPMVKEINVRKEEDTRRLFDLISSETAFFLDLSKGVLLREGRGSGIILGGNLSLISSLIGTSFMPSMKKRILFIEERGESLYRIDRMLTHLRLSGLFKELVGLIAGSFTGCDDVKSVNRLLEEAVEDLNIPVVSSLPIGHGKENAPFPIGVHAVLDTRTMTISAVESHVEA